ncbi:MAG: hypothetical protein Q8L15_18410 [Methylobacter sp.]|nr:hypothetical protein [Methylobacter sp.]
MVINNEVGAERSKTITAAQDRIEILCVADISVRSVHCVCGNANGVGIV